MLVNMRGSDLIYGCVNNIYCHFNKTSLNKKNCIESTQWLSTKNLQLILKTMMKNISSIQQTFQLIQKTN